jgi:hypothetical protein
MKRYLLFLFTAIFLYACNNSQTVQTETPSYTNEPDRNNPSGQSYAPQPGDSSLVRGNAFVNNSELLVMESYPVQIMLVLEGELPTPCNQLRVAASPPDEQNRIDIDVYSVSDPDEICIQVLDPFEANFGLGSFPSGHYSVWVNDEMIGEFDS